MYLPLVSELLGIGKDWLEGRRKIAQAELDSKLRINEAKTKSNEARLDTAQAGDIAWENTSISNSGWKDEYWTLILSIPCIMCFVPGLVPYVQAGFSALALCPEWYQWAMGVSIASSFGYKKIADFMSLKKGI